MSGGILSVGIFSATSGLTVSGDVSLNNKLFVSADASLNGNVSLANDLTIGGNMYVKTYTTRQVITTLSYQLIIAEDISLNGRLFISNDLSVNGNISLGKALTVGGLVSANAGLTVPSGATLNVTNATITGLAASSISSGLSGTYALLAAPTFTGTTTIADASINGNLKMAAGKTLDVTGATITGLAASSVSGISGTYALLAAPTFTGTTTTADASINGNIKMAAGKTLDVTGATITGLAASSVSGISGTYALLAAPTFTGTTNTSAITSSGVHTVTSGGIVISGGDASFNNKLYVGLDASLGGRLFVAGDVSMNGKLSIANDLTIGGNLYVNTYTTKQVITTLSYQLIIAEDISLNGRLFISNDASVNGNINLGKALTVGGLVSANAGLTVPSGQTLTVPSGATLNVTGATVTGLASGSSSYFATDVSMASRLFVIGDVSMGGKMNLNNTIAAISTVTPNLAGLATYINGWTNNGLTWTASATADSYNINAAFGTSVTASWIRIGNLYSTTSNTSTIQTIITGVGSVQGDWLQIQCSSPIVMQSYQFASGVNDAAYLPKTYYIVGSNDNSTWYPIQYCSVAAQPVATLSTIITNAITVNSASTQTLGTSTVTTTTYTTTTNNYSYFRIIPTAIFINNGNPEIGLWILTFQLGSNNINMSTDSTVYNQLNINSALSVKGTISVTSDASMNGNIVSNNVNFIANSGTKWSIVPTLPTSTNWTNVTISSTGQYMAGTTNGSGVYFSAGYGVSGSWNQIPNSNLPTANNWTGLTMSLTGQYMVATTNASGVYMSTSYGVSGSWAQIPTSTLPTTFNYQASAISATGQYILTSNNTAGGVYMSTSYGVSGSWNMIPSTSGITTNSAWQGLAISSTGQYMLAGINTGSVYMSSNSGQVWAAIPTASLPNTGNWKSLNISTTGQYMLAGDNNGNGASYLSNNYGQTWTKNTGGESSLTGCQSCLSSTGQYMLIQNYSGYKTLLFSNNYGSTWTNLPFGVYNGNGVPLAMSGTGLYMLAAITYGSVYISSALSYSNITGSNGINNIAPQYDLDVSGQINASQGVLTTNVTATTVAYQPAWAPITTLGSGGSWYYNCAAMSSSGQYMLLGKRGGAIYLSTNYGFIWSAITALSTASWSGMSMSSTGQYMLAPINTSASSCWMSTNYGVTWATVTALSTANWLNSSISSTGQYMLAGLTSSSLYLNSNYGTGAWTVITAVSTGSWRAISMSSSGQYMLVGIYAPGNKFYLSKNYGSTWSSIFLTNGFTNSANNCSISSSGQYMLALHSASASYTTSISYLSADYGTTWSIVPLPNNTSWNSSCISQTGQYMFISNNLSTNNNFYSTNYGSTWSVVSSLNIQSLLITSSAMSANGQFILAPDYSGSGAYLSSGIPTSALGVNNPNPQYSLDISGTMNVNGLITTGTNYGAPSTWSLFTGALTSSGFTSMSMSSNGQYMLATFNGTIGFYQSTNFGVTWTQFAIGTFATGSNWSQSSTSSTGQYQLVCGSAVGVYLSTSFGSTFSAIVTGTLPTNYSWAASVISSTGQYMLSGTSATNGMYLSSNYGVAWAQITTGNLPLAGGYFTAAISANGQFMLTGYYASAGALYMSSDYGVTWNAIPSGAGVSATAIWSQVAMSSTGQYMAAAASSGYTYISNNYGANWMQLSTTNIGAISTGNSTVAMSGNGQYMTAASTNGVYISSSYGTQWSLIPNNILPTNYTWRCACISSNGQYIANGNSASPYGFYLSSGTQALGINNVNPQYALDVAGAINSTGKIYVSGDASLNGRLFVGGATTANAGLTVPSGQTLTVTGATITGLTASSVSGISGTYAPLASPALTGTTTTSAITASGLITASAGLTVASGQTLTSSGTTVTNFLGIGTTPTYPLHVTSTANSINWSAGSTVGWAVANQYQTNKTDLAVQSLSAYFANIVAATAYIAFSDRRIKTNIIDIDDVSALETLRQIKPRRYNYIDTISRSGEPVWGFIAQEVRETLPYSTILTKNVIPNIFDMANVANNNTITLMNKSTSLFSRDTSGNLFQLSLNDIRNREIKVTIAEIIDDKTFTITEPLLSEQTGAESPQIFVYGSIVDDFHNLDKNAIFTISTAALQELDREYQQTKCDVIALQSRLDVMERRLANAGIQ